VGKVKINPNLTHLLLKMFGGENMERSPYLLFLKSAKNSNYWIYQTLFRKITEVNKSVFFSVLENRIETLSQTIKTDLRKNEILVDNPETHWKIYAFYFYKTKFYPTTPGVVIVPGFGCNLRCTYCYQGIYPKSSEPMNEDVLNELIRYLKGLDNLKIGFYGGEPTVFENHLIKILDSLDSEKVKSISLITNGVNLSNRLIDSLSKFENVLLQITFAGDKKTHDRLRPMVGGGGSFEKIYNNLRKVLEKGKFTVLVRIDVCEDNYESIPLLLEKLKEFRNHIKVGFEKVLPPHVIPCDYKISVIDDEKISYLFSLARALGFKFPIGEKGDLPLFSFCAALTVNSITINPKGEVYKCMGFADLHHMKCGELSKKGIIWNENYFNWMSRDPLKMEGCKECPVLPLCNGGCAMEAFHRYGTIHAKGCDDWKGYVKKIIVPYLISKYSLPEDLSMKVSE